MVSSPPQRLRPLLHLEWALLVIMVIGESAQGLNLFPRWPLLNVMGILGFASMGLRLPKTQSQKMLYVSTEIILLLVTSLIGGLRMIGLWFVIIVIRNSQFLRRSHRLGVTALAFVLFAILQFYRRNTLINLPWLELSPTQVQRLWFVGLLTYGLSILVMQILLDSLLAEYHNRHRLSVANTQIRQYASQVEDLATSQERNRIAQEIHDALGHSLTALNVHLEAVDKLWTIEPQEAQVLLKEARQLANKALTDVRQSVSSLRTDPLVAQSLTEAINVLLEDLRRTHTVEVQSDISLSRAYAPSLKICVYRIMQEAFTNILKHSGASVVSIKAHDDAQLELLIQDNGQGFDLTQNTTGFGLESMQERARAMKGNLEIVTEPGMGCKLQLSFPINDELYPKNAS